jgi:hypothetical protein
MKGKPLGRHPSADSGELPSAFQTETLFGGWAAPSGDMVRFRGHTDLSTDAVALEQTLFLLILDPGTKVKPLSSRARALAACAQQQADPGSHWSKETRCAYKETLNF